MSYSATGGRQPDPNAQASSAAGASRRSQKASYATKWEFIKDRPSLVIGSVAVMLGCAKMWIIDAQFTLDFLKKVGWISSDYASVSLSIPLMGTLTFWHVIPLLISIVQWRWIPWEVSFHWALLPISFHRRKDVNALQGFIWVVALVFNLGTSYNGVADWIATLQPLPIWGTISLPKEGAIAFVTAVGLGLVISQGSEIIGSRTVKGVVEAYKLPIVATP